MRNKTAALFLAVNASACSAAAPVGDPLAAYRNRNDMQGLLEIRERARVVIDAENRQRHTRWTLLDPDIRIVLTRCAVPMTAALVMSGKQAAGPYVLVACSRTVSPQTETNWSIPVLIDQHLQKR